jgi:hypothetical protein
VPVGLGVVGEMAASTVTVVPCVIVEEVMASVVVLGVVAEVRVKEEAGDTEDW